MATILTQVDASRSASGGYKVDISRGERIGRVSSEWFSRPDDERFLSLTELHAAVKARAERATTRSVETREVRVEAMHHLRRSFLVREPMALATIRIR